MCLNRNLAANILQVLFTHETLELFRKLRLALQTGFASLKHDVFQTVLNMANVMP